MVHLNKEQAVNLKVIQELEIVVDDADHTRCSEMCDGKEPGRSYCHIFEKALAQELPEPHTNANFAVRCRLCVEGGSTWIKLNTPEQDP
jgi:hypothetical protein